MSPEDRRHERNENARRRFTTNPRYSHKGGLPSVFPFKRVVTQEDLSVCVRALLDVVEGEVDEPIGFAVTRVSLATHYTLWLSQRASLLLSDLGYLAYIDETE